MSLLDFIQYPTKAEWTSIANEFPIIRKIKIDKNLTYNSNKEQDIIDSLIRPNDFHQWHNLLFNKLGKVNFSYILLIYYSNKLPSHEWNDEAMNFYKGFTEKDFSNKIMFDYYTENFYHYYFSSIDIIHHLLNIYFNLNIEASNDFARNVRKKIPNSKLKEKLCAFVDKIRNDYSDRNNLTHNFPFYEIDMRSKKEGEFYSMDISFIRTTEIIFKIHDILIRLEKILRIIEHTMNEEKEN